MLDATLSNSLLKEILFPLFSFFLNAIILWKIFKKAGEKQSYAFIPFYRIWILFKIIDLSKICFWINAVMIVLVKVLNIISSLVKDFSIVLLILSIVFSVTGIIIHILQTNQIGNSFGKGRGFKIGYFFLPTIFGLILAFDKSKYIGPNGVKISKKKRKN